MSYTDAQTLFITGTAAMFPGGSWEAAYFGAENLELELGVFAVPAKGTDERLSSWFVDGAWAVPASAEDQAAALEFVDWLGTPEFAPLFSDRLAQISPIEGVIPTDPVLQDIVSLYDKAATEYILLVYFRYGTPSGTDVIGEGLQKFLDDMTAYFLNSVLVTGVSVVLVLAVGSLAAYPLGRYAFRGKAFLTSYFLAGLMLPICLGILPRFFLMRTLGPLDTPFSLVAIYASSGLPFTIFVLSSFFEMPRELEDAARLDGAGEFRIYAQVMLPLMRPALATGTIFNFTPWWNDFFFPLIFIRSEAFKTLPLGLFGLFGERQNDWALLFAGLTLTTLPLLIVYLLASKPIIRGLTSGALR